jgi:hypothetical protein
MKRCRLVLVPFAAALSLLLAACAGDTALHFANKTECGMATITITNTSTGDIEEFQVDEGKTIAVIIKPSVTYHYEVTYAGRPDSKLSCEAKKATVLIPEKGQNANVSLLSATPTPAPN